MARAGSWEILEGELYAVPEVENVTRGQRSGSFGQPSGGLTQTSEEGSVPGMQVDGQHGPAFDPQLQMVGADVAVRQRQQAWDVRSLHPVDPRLATDDDRPGELERLAGGAEHGTERRSGDEGVQRCPHNAAADPARGAVGRVRMAVLAHRCGDQL